MVKIVWGVIAGFVLWSAFWVVSDLTLAVLSPDWYGNGLENVTNGYLLIALARSIFISIIAGYIASFIARQNSIQTALILGVLLFLFGVFVQVSNWNKIPLWYHLIFLGLLVPMTWLGAKLRTA